jgi:hypothetical protein
MSDPFDSSRRKIARAKNHLTDLKREVLFFFEQKPYEIFTDPDPTNPKHLVHKLRLTCQIPDAFSAATGDVVDNLRAALDHAMYGVAIASGCKNPREAYFPFSKDAASFERTLKGRCRDVPQEIYPLLRSYEPYKGGSETLWALNLLCIANKHKLVVPVGTATFNAGMSFSATGFVSMPYDHAWNRIKNEMELFTADPMAQLKGNFNLGFYIAFGEIESVDGKPAIETLDLFVDMVETILREIEAESRRLGFIN